MGDALREGFEVPGVELTAELGRGASTVVFRALRNGREYAVKMLLSVGDASAAVAFRREAALLAGLEHHGLVDIHEVGDAGGHPYLVMDLVEGRSLARLLWEESASGGGQDVRWVAEIGRELADALVVVHRAGLVHRDVKPDNIIIGVDGRAKLIDFGLATRSGASGVAAGTFRYSAPEQTGALHRGVDGRADLYSLGVVLFECLAGRAPFNSEDVGELIAMHLSTPVPDLRAMRPDVAPSIAAVVTKLLAKDPDDRYQSGQGLAADLARVAAGEREEFPVGCLDTTGSGDPALIGRQELLAQLVREWHRVPSRLPPADERSRHRGGLVVVVGAPGIGKSRLMREMTGWVRAEEYLVLAAGTAADNAVPFAPLRSLIDQQVASISGLPRADRESAIEELRVAAGPTAALLGEVSPALAGLLGDVGAEAGRNTDERAFADAIGVLLLGLAEGAGGAVLHLDDLQWWDEGTRRVLRQLAPRLRESALLVVVTGRDDPDSQAALDAFDADLGAFTDLRLSVGPLDDAGVDALVTEQLGGGTAPPELASMLAVRSAGNPLAVAEYVRAITDAGLVQPFWGAWQLDAEGLDALALPENVMDLVVRRVEALGGLGRELLTVAAAVGTRFEPWLVAAVAGTELDATLAVFADAAGHQLVETTPDGGFGFLHDRIRLALIDGTDPTARRALHQRIAEIMDATGTGPAHVYAVARHYLAGQPDTSPAAAFRAIAAAGALALAQHAPVDALDYLTRAEAIAGPAGLMTDTDFRTALGSAAIKTGHYATGDAQLDLALQTERDPLRRAGIYRQLAKSHQMRWCGNEAHEMVQRGLAEVGGSLPHNPVLLAVTTVFQLLAGLLLGYLPARWRVARGRAARTLEMRAELIGVGAQYAAMAMQPLLTLAFGLRFPLLGCRVESDRAQADARTTLGMLAITLHMPRRMQRLLAQAVEAAARTGDPQVIGRIAYLRAGVQDGAIPFGPETGRAMLRVLEAYGHMIDVGDVLSGYGLIGQVRLLRGYQTDVAEWYRRGLAAVDRPEEVLGGNFATIGAQAAALAGEPALAAAGLREVGEYVATLAENRAQRTNLAMAAVHIAVEEGETGVELDRVLAEFAALGVRPALAATFQRPLWVYQAFGRLAQLAAAEPEQRQARQAQATAAVRDLKKVASGAVLGAFHLAAEASLRQLSGDLQSALRLVADLQTRAGSLDLPLLNFEIARIQARAWRELDCADASRHAAQTALLLAAEYGWQTRARWIRTEFGLQSAEHTTGPPSRRFNPTRQATMQSRTGTMSIGADGPHQNRRLTALHQVSLAAATVLEPGPLARVALDEIVRIFGAERAFLFLVDGDVLTPFLGRDNTQADLDELTGYGSTLVERVRRDREPIVVTGSEQGAALGSQSTLIHGLRSIMVAPLLLRGRLVGVVYLDSRAAKGIFTTDDIDILAAITNHIATSLETVRAAQLEVAVRAAERERDTAVSMREAMRDLTDTLDPAEVETRLATRVAAVLPGSTVRVLRGGSDNTLIGGPLDGLSLGEAPFPATPGGWEGALLRGTSAGTPPPASLAPLLPAGTNAWLAIPLSVRGEARGVLVAFSPDRPYTDNEVQVAAALAGQGAVALDNAILFRTTQELATLDGLTGLYNRRHFLQVADQQVANSLRDPLPTPGYAAIMIDIDHFKAVNDTHGHPVGDEVIREVAARLAAALRETDLLCRYGGEEFAVLLPETTVAEADAAAARLLATIADRPIPTRAGDLTVTISVGLAEYPEPQDLQAMLTRADHALYNAKRGGRNRVATA